MPFLLIPVFTGYTLFWLLASILVGLGYAWFLYGANNSLSKTGNHILFGARALTVACIAFLLGAPLIKSVTKTFEKPLIVIAQDNSASIELAKPKGFNSKKYSERLKAVIKDLSDSYDVETFTFGDSVSNSDNFNFTDKTTNITSVLTEINQRFAGRNIGSIVLATDGIYNKGGTPEVAFGKIKSPVYTVALGDTIPKRDLLIANVNYNTIVFSGNRFQIEIDVEAYQAKGSTTTLSVNCKGGQSITKKIRIGSNDFRQTIPVILEASRKGITAISINLGAISNELSFRNNSKTIFVDVVDGKKKILILANSPHPDISAIKQSLENNKNYEVRVRLREVKPQEINEAALIILHQVPSSTFSRFNYNQLLKKKSLWIILGSQTDFNTLTSYQDILKLNPAGVDEFLAQLNSSFYLFALSDEIKDRLKSFPPLLSPKGTYSFTGNPSSILLTQKNKNPLLVFKDEHERRIGILAGEGLWRWKLDEFEKYNSHQGFDELVRKTAQYLSSKNDKRKFRAYPAKNVYDENERIQLNAELYNDAFEPVNQPDVSITLEKGKNRSYSYLFTRTDHAYNLDAGVLAPGEYNFTAKTKLGDKEYTSLGKFNITKQDIEFVNTTANHRLLYSAAKENNGAMIYPAEIEKLYDLIKRNELIKTIVYEEKSYDELIDFKFLFFLILGLLSLEWFFRKRTGEL